MTTNVTIKNAAGTDVIFEVVRQPSAGLSAILYEKSVVAGMNRTGLAKIELSSKIANGRLSPVASVVVPYGGMVNGNFVKTGQVTDTRAGTQPADTPTQARLDAAAFARNLASNPQVIALFETGLVA